MYLSEEIQESLKASVLCWLATISEDGSPNVTPKEAFLYDGIGHILIANIASPNSVANILTNPQVCVSFIDVFIQKGFKIKGTARIIKNDDATSEQHKKKLLDSVGSKFNILSIIEVTPAEVKPIIAPSYRIFHGVTEEKIIDQSMKTYRVAQYLKRSEKADDSAL